MSDNKANFLFLLQTVLLGQIITHKMDTNTAEGIADDALVIDPACLPEDANRLFVWAFINYRLGLTSKPHWLVFSREPFQFTKP